MRRASTPPRAVRRTVLAIVAASSLVAAACGGGATAPSSDPSGAVEAPVAGDGAPVIRFALPTEPLWQWLNDSGALASWQQEHGLRIEASHPFEPFTAFVGGHADIILIDALDIPVFSRDLESDPTIIGKYSSDRSIAAVKRTSQATDLGHVVEGGIAMESELGSTLLWSLIVEQAHALDLRYGSRDFEYIIATSGIAETVDRGGADACICMPDQSVANLSTGILRPLYDGKSAATVYAELMGHPDRSLLGKVFVADREWHRTHAAEVSAFLELWELAVQNWNVSYAGFIAAYPQLMSVQTDEEIAWLSDYVSSHNWIVPSVYPTDADAQRYLDAVAKLQANGRIPADAKPPPVITNRSTAGGGE